MIVRRKKPFLKKRAFSFRPDFIAQSVSDIDFELLATYGIKICFVDLDGTVVERGKFEVSKKTIDTLKNSKLKVYIATNRPKSRDLKNLRQDLHSEGVIHPHFIYAKPTRRYFENALLDFSLKRNEVVMIGDRFFQDMYGANRAGIFSLLVRKLDRSQGFFDHIISRVEKHYMDRLVKRYTK